MSVTAIALNGLLAVLLIVALAYGMRLERRLKALRDSHEGFTKAVADLDRAAQRAEQGLADLRAATDEASETLGDRIAQAKVLASQLDERLTRPLPAPSPAAERPERSERSERLAERLERSAPRPAATTRPTFDPEPSQAEETRRRLKAEDFERLLERESRVPRDAAPPPARTPSASKETSRSRARIDDDLFDGPSDPPSSHSTFRGRR